MEIRLLGTGGADGIPGFFVNDRVSAYARQFGGKDIRTRCGALIDGHIKIDLPPDTFCQVQRDGLNTRDWSALIFTHSHDDHFAVSEIQYSLIPFTEEEEWPCAIYANETVAGRIAERYPQWPIELRVSRSFESFEHSGYLVTPIKANHIPGEDCHNLIFQKDGCTLLYGTDTGIWPEETFEALKGFFLDLLIIECTEGFSRSDYKGHLNLDDLTQVIRRLHTLGTINQRTRIVTTHHASSGNATHDELVGALAPLGAEPGFDGMVIKVGNGA